MIEYFETILHIKADKITIGDINSENILGFLKWLEDVKKVKIQTRNHRLNVLRSFSTYMMKNDPLHMFQWKEIKSIPLKKAEETLSMLYLSVDEITFLLDSIDTKTSRGRRDFSLLSMLYYSAARATELINMTPSSLRLSKPYGVQILGKGGTSRFVPLDEDVVELLKQYLSEKHLDQPENVNKPLFSNAWGEKLSNAGIAYIVDKYVKKAKNAHPELYKINITPHTFRHSRASHLAQAGVPLIYIRDILGHKSVTTTEHYAKADSLKKKEALEKAYESNGIKEPKIKSWEKNNKLKDFLKSLV